jgi:4-hydroxybenzoate polyprenyltransferase
MNGQAIRRSKIQNLRSKIADYGSLVRFSHTVFALPFALSSVALAWPKHPVTFRILFWILVAMVGARTAAMGFNRLADRKFDALNPRTQSWELPRGAVKVREAGALTTAAALIFLFAAYQLNWTCFVLSPIALAIILFYSLTKRFTWSSHLFLGLALAIAPIGAWLAVSTSPLEISELLVPFFLGLAVVFWLAGFDIIYSLQDRDFDRSHGLYSIPVRFGVAGALTLSSFFHVLTVVCFAGVGISAGMGPIYWIGFLAVAAVLIWEHRIVTPTDLSRINRAFFDLNAYVSIGYFLFTAADIAVRTSSSAGG